jgi:hypothetical protein
MYLDHTYRNTITAQERAPPTRRWGSTKFDIQDDPWQKTKISVASLRRYRGRKRDRNELDWVIAMPGFSDRIPSE